MKIWTKNGIGNAAQAIVRLSVLLPGILAVAGLEKKEFWLAIVGLVCVAEFAAWVTGCILAKTMNSKDERDSK